MTIPISEEQNPDYRVCLGCNKWVSLLGSTDECGKNRDYNRMPATEGICTCWVKDPSKRWNVKVNQ